MSQMLNITEDRINRALVVAVQHGGIAGAHHKTWVIDQMCRALLGDQYDSFVRIAREGEDGSENAYDWDEGIAP